MNTELLDNALRQILNTPIEAPGSTDVADALAHLDAKVKARRVRAWGPQALPQLDGPGRTVVADALAEVAGVDTRGRPRVGGARVEVTIPEGLLDVIEGRAEAEGVSRAAMIRQMLTEASGSKL